MLPEVAFDNAELSDVVDFFRDVTGANIRVDWRSLEAANVHPKSHITLKLRNRKFVDGLQDVLDAAGGNEELVFFVSNGVLFITTRTGALPIV